MEPSFGYKYKIYKQRKQQLKQMLKREKQVTLDAAEEKR